MSLFRRRGLSREYEVSEMFSSAALRVQPRGTVDAAWVEAAPVGHLCWPPQHYPAGYGPHSRWQCSCGVEWSAEGLRVLPGSQYPTRPGREDVFTGPWRWLYVRGIKNGPWACGLTSTQEMDLYDWRTADMVIVPLLRDAVRYLGISHGRKDQ